MLYWCFYTRVPIHPYVNQICHREILSAKYMSDDRALILIDCQVGFNNPFWGQRNNPDFEANAKAVLAHWRARGRRIIHVRHASLKPNSPLRAEEPGFAFFEWAEPRENEVEIIKHVNSCFIGTGLEDLLQAEGHYGLVLLGLTTNHCVSTTARMAGNLGFDVCLVGDACATFPRTAADGEAFDADLVHRTALASLHEEFCTVLSSERLLSEE